MVTNVSSTAATPKAKLPSRGSSPAKAKRPPLNEADNNGPPLTRRPKSRDISSRYLSYALSSSSSNATTVTSTSSSSFNSTTTNSSSNSMCTPRRRFPSPSPLVSSTNLMTPATTANKRAQSTERRRPGTPRVGEISNSAKMLSSARSLSVSFQGESFAIPACKTPKPTPVVSINGSRHVTPERRHVTPERRPVTPRKVGPPKPIDQQRWPGRLRQGSFMTKSVDLTNENVRFSGSGIGSAVKDLQKSMIRKTELIPSKPEIPEMSKSVDTYQSDNSDRVISDAESVSSGSIRGTTSRAIMVPARYRQETVNRLSRVQPEPVSPPLTRSSRLISENRYLKDGPTLSPRGSSPSPVRAAVRPVSPSPVRAAVRPASPNRSVLTTSTSSPSRGMASPTRARAGIGSNSNLGNKPSILNFAAESRRRKVGDIAVVDAHILRLLHNKYLQWRFANARADTATMVQRATAEKSLYDSWVTTTKMRKSVISKRIEIQNLRQDLKLRSVLKNQIPYLNVWDQDESYHSLSLSETIMSLESSTLRLPLVDGAKADVQSLKDAIRSAFDVMQTMTSSIRSLVTKLEHVTSLTSELAITSSIERSKLDECKDLLSILTHMEVQECSLRTHIIQPQRLPPRTVTEL